MLKPSEATPAMSSLLAELFPKYVDPSIVRVVNGGVEETTKVRPLAWYEFATRANLKTCLASGIAVGP